MQGVDIFDMKPLDASRKGTSVGFHFFGAGGNKLCHQDSGDEEEEVCEREEWERAGMERRGTVLAYGQHNPPPPKIEYRSLHPHP